MAGAEGAGLVWRHVDVAGRIAAVALLALALFCGAGAAWAAGKKSSGKKSGEASCVDKDDPPTFVWQKFKSGDTCVEFTNTLTAVYQRLLRSSGRLAEPSRRNTVSASNPESKTLTYETSLKTTTPTGLGDLATSFGIKLERSAGDTYVYTTLNEGTVSLAGVTAGYADSAMNFWSGDFQFNAAAASRTVGVARYEYEVIPDGKIGLSLETGVPTSQTNSRLFAPVYPKDPVVALRWLYETDPLSVQLAAMTHRAKVEPERQIPGVAGRPDHFSGWAATAGATVALPMIHEDDEISGQATYAANASSYLGTKSDLSTLANTLPFSVETRGWSAVASYHRQWSDQWESNVFVSRLELDITTPLGDPRLRSTRYAGNLIFKPRDDIKIGGELGLLDVWIENRGLLGVVRGASGRGLTGYLFVAADF